MRFSPRVVLPRHKRCVVRQIRTVSCIYDCVHFLLSDIQTDPFPRSHNPSPYRIPILDEVLKRNKPARNERMCLEPFWSSNINYKNTNLAETDLILTHPAQCLSLPHKAAKLAASFWRSSSWSIDSSSFSAPTAYRAMKSDKFQAARKFICHVKHRACAK